jgi:glutamate racemase
MERSAPVGVFDSGVGGLTVLRELRASMPDEDFIYLGDTARLPYGSKSAETVARYSLQCAQRLVERGIRSLVIACNTASASALPALRAKYPGLPIFGVIEPGAAAAIAVSGMQHIGVIATQATIDGQAYERAILAMSPRARVSSRICSLFVAMAEEGWVDGPIAAAVAHRYLDQMFAAVDAPDTLVLGCTHFPLLLPVIRDVVPPGVRIVDSAATTARSVCRVLSGSGGGARGSAGGRGSVRWLATDGAARFANIGSRFLGESIRPDQVEVVDL